MLRLTICVVFACVLSGWVWAAEQSPSEKAIAEAIALLESKRDTIGDALETAKIDKAIRELEALIEDPDHPKPAETPEIKFEVKTSVLKKKFVGKPTYNSKTGELTIDYDFAGKPPLADFESTNAKVVVQKKVMLVDAGERLTHVAHFKNFTATAVLTIKGMRGAGLASTNGSQLKTGGNGDTIFLEVAGALGARKALPFNQRSGNIPVSLSINSSKTSIRFSNELLAAPTARKDDLHQVILVSGAEGCGFSNLVITGVPDPAWFKEFLETE